jgi:hypothetical protein
MLGRESQRHVTLKTLALEWALAQGLSLAATEVSFPHRRFRVDAAACCPVRKVPSRRPVESLHSVLKAAAIFECKQARGDLIRDNQRRELMAGRLRTLQSRREKLESLLQLHLPHLSNGESLFPEFDSYRLREHRHDGYRRLVRHIDTAKRSVLHGTKFDRLLSYRMANLHYLVVEESLLHSHEAPTGWGLLVRSGGELQLIAKPVWQDIGLEHQLVFLQRIAARGRPAGLNLNVAGPESPAALA